jgi:putative DNA primase/helicase
MSDDGIAHTLDDLLSRPSAIEAKAKLQQELRKAADEAEFTRLAALPPVELDREKKAAAKKMGISIATLVDEVLKRREGAQSVASATESLAPDAPIPCVHPVNGLRLVDDLRVYVERFVVVERHASIAIVLWIIFTYLLEVAEHSPRLAILGPSKRCGKTTLLGLLGMLAYRVVSASNISPSAVFRVIGTTLMSLFVDEADSFTRDNEELRGLLNSGHSRATAYVIRSIKVNDDWQPKRFSTWSAIAMAAIGQLPDTWMDRSIVVSMKRKATRQAVERLWTRNKVAHEQAAVLRSQIARWVADHRAELIAAEPEIPEVLDDRAVNNWYLLLGIADMVGGDWPKASREAAVSLSASRSDSGSYGEILIGDIHDIFDAENADCLTSAKLCEALAKMESRPWAEYGKARRPISPTQLARLLKPFDVAPGTIRIGADTAKGYHFKAFVDAFARYYTPVSPVTPSQVNGESGFNDFSAVTTENDVTAKKVSFPHGENGCDGVTARNGYLPKEKSFES